MLNKFIHKKIKVGKKIIQAYLISLLTKNLIILVGKSGFVMCGYLNLRVANKFKDVAIKVVGVSSIEEMLRAKVHSCTYAAKRMGVYKGQNIKDVLKIVA